MVSSQRPARRAAASMVFALGAIGTAAVADMQIRTWSVGTSARHGWSDASAWNPASVPQNGASTTYTAIIPAASIADMDMNVTLDSLEIAPGSYARMNPGRSLTVGELHNNGTLKRKASQSIQPYAYLKPLWGDLDCMGTGEIFAEVAVQPLRIQCSPPSERLVNHEGHTISGHMEVSGRCANFGTLKAVGTATFKLLPMDPPNQLYNAGLITADGMGVMDISGGAIDNSRGVISATAFATVRCLTLVQGGVISTEGSAIAELGRIDGVTLLGETEYVSTKLLNSVINHSTLQDDDVVTTPRLWLATPVVTLSGTGSLEGHSNCVFSSDVSGYRLVHQSPHVIHKAMVMTFMKLTNHSLIDGSQGAGIQLTLVGTSNDNINLGVIRSSNGSAVSLNGGLDNSQGQLIAGNASEIKLGACELRGGTIHAEGTGLIRVMGQDSKVDNVTFEAPTLFDLARRLSIVTTLTNNGLMSYPAGTGQGSYSGGLSVVSERCFLMGTGEFRTRNAAGENIVGWNCDPHTLVNGPQHTISGAPRIFMAGIENQGLIKCDMSVGGYMESCSELLNLGTFLITDAGKFSMPYGDFRNAGLLQVDAGRLLTKTGNLSQEGGQCVVNGTVTLSSNGTLLMSGGELSGCGIIAGSLSATGGSVRPGCASGALTVTGAATLANGSELNCRLAGSPMSLQFGRLTVSGAAQVHGSVSVSLDSGFVPNEGDEFTIVTASALQFAAESAVLPPYATLESTATELRVRFGAALPSDFNRDGVVDGADLGILLGAWGACESCAEDLSYDGIVDGADLGMLLGTWGHTP